MTDNNNNKLRAVFFAALMVLWVFAGTMAFAGSAAAATGNASASYADGTPTPDSPLESANHNITVTNADSGSSVQSILVDFSGDNGNASGIDLTNVNDDDVEVNVSDGSSIYTGTTNGVDADGDGDIDGLSIDVDSTPVAGNTPFTISIQNVKNPSAGTYRTNVSFSSGDSVDYDSTSIIAGANATYTIQGSVSTGSATGVDDTWTTGGQLRWQGQSLYFDANKSEAGQYLEDFQIREWDSTASTFSGAVSGNARQLSLDDGYIVINTDDLEGSYVITAYNSSSQQREAVLTNTRGEAANTTRSTASSPYVEIAVQGLNTSFVDDEVNLGDTETLEVNSDRTPFAMNVTSDSFTGEELASLFDEAETTDDDDVARFTGVTNEPDELTFNTSSDARSFDLETGNYTFDFEVNDTTASDSATITVSEEVAGDANFDESQYTAHRGDIANITYTTQELDTTTLHIGGKQDGYNATLVVEPNDDGEVAVEFNTFTASENNPSNEVFTVTKGTLDEVVEEEELVGYRLESGNYDLEITASNETQDLSRLRLSERNYNDLTVHTAPSNEFTRLNSKERVYDRIENGWVTESEEIAVAPPNRGNGRMGDVIVYQVEAEGLEGYLNERAGNNPLETMLGTNYFDLHIDQTNPTQNRYPKRMELDQSFANNSFHFVSDTENDTYFIVVKSDRLRFDRAENQGGEVAGEATERAQPGDKFNSTFQINDDYEELFIRGDAENVSNYGDLEIVDREADFDTRGGNITAQAVEGAEITGETTVAPGTELTLFVEGDAGDEGAPVFENSVTRVSENGTFSATFDFSGAEDGQTFTATISAQSFEDNAETPGVFGEPTGASYDVSDLSLSSTSVEAGEDVDVSATVTNSGDVAGNQTISILVDDSEVDSQTVALEPGEDAEVSSTISTSDLSGDVTVEVASADDSASTTLTVETEATPTATPSEGTATPEPGTATATESQDQPGFGAGLALIALLGAALLAARRNAF